MKSTNQKYANLKRTKSCHQLLNMQYEFIKATSGSHISKKINKTIKSKWAMVGTSKLQQIKFASIKN